MTIQEQRDPALRFTGFEGEWEEKVISEVSTKITDGTHDSPKPTTAGIPYLTAVHIKDGFIDYDNCYYLPLNIHNKIYSRCNPQKGDLLMVNIGAGTATVAQVEVDYEFSIKNVALIKPNRDVVFDYFFTQVQRKNSARLRHQLTSGGAQPFLALKQIGKLKLSIPPIPEQKKIASFLYSVDTKIEQLTTKISKLKKYKKGIMQKLFSQEVRFKDDEEKEYPEWGAKKAKDLFKNQSNKNHNGDLPILSASQEHGMIYREGSGIEIQSSEKSVKSYKIVEPGDFVITLRSFQGGLDYSSIKGICSPAYIVLKNAEPIEEGFYKQYFKKESFIERLSKTTVGIRDGKQITYGNFGALELLSPSLPEQKKIADFLSSIDDKIEQVGGELEKAKMFKKGLFQQMFV